MVQKQVVDNEKIDAASLKNKNDILLDFREYTFFNTRYLSFYTLA